jgi:hypothetical protein
VSEPTSKPPDATRPVAKPPAKAPPVAKRLDTPPASAAVIPGKSSAVIAKSYRVRELPPPPVITPPVVNAPQAGELLDDIRKGDSPIFADTKIGTVPEYAPEAKEPEPSI